MKKSKLSEFYDIFPDYDVVYQDTIFTISDKDLGDLGRLKHQNDLSKMKGNAEEILINHLDGHPVHVIKGIILDMVRYYTELVTSQKEVIDKYYNYLYSSYKVITMQSVVGYTHRTVTENNKPLTDTLVKSFVRLDNLVSDTDLQSEYKDKHREAIAALKELTYVLERLKVSLEIITDTYKTAISLNANERASKVIQTLS